MVLAEFANGETKMIPGSYVEFAERKVLEPSDPYPKIRFYPFIAERI
jgi:hypothetical protein